jgi:hypothetical protein
MGLAFTGTATDQEATLLDWMSELGGDSPIERQGKAAPEIKSGEETPLARALSLKEVVQELVALLLRKKILTEAEAARFLGNQSE